MAGWLAGWLLPLLLLLASPAQPSVIGRCSQPPRTGRTFRLLRSVRLAWQALTARWRAVRERRQSLVAHWA